jgi:4-diphosphocytidyl-2-C-methyl-D-erythritol kinase
MRARRRRRVRVDALAKVNLTLRILGRNGRGYHELRTVFQTIALRDRLTLTELEGPFTLKCSDPACPSDSRNLVWRAADLLWSAAGRRGVPSGVQVRLEKAIPPEAGLGGGSTDAAAALRALSRLWGLEIDEQELARVAARLGADVPFFLQGGTALGVHRGDVIFPLSDFPPHWVVVAKPVFGVSTADAFRWYDEDSNEDREARTAPIVWKIPSSELRNDLEGSVVARHPMIGRIARRLERCGALYAAMSGSGSAVFGLFRSASAARSAANVIHTHRVATLVTRTLTARQAAVASRLRT